MFRKSQRFYDAVYAWKDYRSEVDRLDRVIRERNPSARTLLDVACGTGKHLELLRHRFRVEGLDLDPEMLAIARRRLGPDVPLHSGDLVGFDLGREFDVVTCLFSSIAYARTADRLGAAIGSMARHVAPDGLLIVEPFFSPDQWEPGHLDSTVVDEPDLKVVRMVLSGPAESPMTMSFNYLVGTPEGIDHFTEEHEVGLFTDQEHRDAFRAAGLEAEHDAEGLMGRGLFIGVRRS
jgi:dTDP-3-amino-3,4,6-trideoxy-alpha-D-glucopyranose N,N-dimethyltransferase